MFHVCAFYHFSELDEERLQLLESDLKVLADKHSLGGLAILAPEGINATVCGSNETIEHLKSFLSEFFPDSSIDYKYSTSERLPFPRFRIRRRAEIVTTGDEPLRVDPGEGQYLTPEQWHATLQSDEDFVLLDTRNWYETEIGKFRGAVDPHFDNFQEFPDFVEKCDIPKDKKVLMYCTGGIRCEKASKIMTERGYSNVFQLHGGILRYLEQFPDGEYQGECFVFDRRVAVTKTLEPTTTFDLCPHYGQPAKTEITCPVCGQKAKVLERCLEEPYKNTCSKNCSYHLKVQSEKAERKSA